MPERLKSSSQRLISVSAWKIRLAFFSGALLVGLVAAIFAICSDYANEWFRHYQTSQSEPTVFLITCFGLILLWLGRSVRFGAIDGYD